MHPGKAKATHLASSTLLFTTVRETMAEFDKTNFSWTGGEVAYFQRYNDFSSCPLCEIANYRHIFQLTRDEEDQLRQYMRYWSILRQCCGSQMSKWFLAELFGCPNTTDFVLEGRIDHHMCGSYNLSSVEQRFVQTSLYSLVPANQLSHPEHLKFLWSQVGDCKKSHDNVRAGIGFNLKKIGQGFCDGVSGWHH